MSLHHPKILLIGVGRVARALVRASPTSVTDVVSRRPAEIAADPLFERITVHGDLPFERFQEVDAIWITSRDDEIAEVARQLLPGGAEALRGRLLLHAAGSLGIEPLEPLRSLGARVAALHPNASIRGDEPLPRGLVWGLTVADDEAAGAARRLAEHFGGEVVEVSGEDRGLYHAAASCAANFPVAIAAMARQLYMRAGLDEPVAARVVAGYLSGAAEGVATLGAEGALTGPAVRGDAGTVGRQIEEVGAVSTEWGELVERLSQLAAALGRAGAARSQDQERSS